MPASPNARTQRVQVPFSEAAMHSRIAGMELDAIEEDTFVNGQLIPVAQRHGCYVITPTGARVPLTKSEAGWRDARIPETAIASIYPGVPHGPARAS